VGIMSKLEDFENLVLTYRLEEAIKDGIVAKLCYVLWNGRYKPYVATANVLEDIGQDGALEIWKEFAQWRSQVMPTLPEEDQLFYTGVEGRTICIIEDDVAYTIMHLEDY
jgi:hypothetical protein